MTEIVNSVKALRPGSRSQAKHDLESLQKLECRELICSVAVVSRRYRKRYARTQSLIKWGFCNSYLAFDNSKSAAASGMFRVFSKPMVTATVPDTANGLFVVSF